MGAHLNMRCCVYMHIGVLIWSGACWMDGWMVIIPIQNCSFKLWKCLIMILISFLSSNGSMPRFYPSFITIQKHAN
jgi:hypothetical protein